LLSFTVWPIPTDQKRSAKEMDWWTRQQTKWPSEEYKRKMLLQPEHASPSLSSLTDQGTAHKREDRPMKLGLKRAQKTGS
jgi:hypothetical protein